MGTNDRDQKDRLGRTLRDKKKADEDRYFAEREKELVRKLKEKLAAARDETEEG